MAESQEALRKLIVSVRHYLGAYTAFEPARAAALTTMLDLAPSLVELGQRKGNYALWASRQLPKLLALRNQYPTSAEGMILAYADKPSEAAKMFVMSGQADATANVAPHFNQLLFEDKGMADRHKALDRLLAKWVQDPSHKVPATLRLWQVALAPEGTASQAAAKAALTKLLRERQGLPSEQTATSVESGIDVTGSFNFRVMISSAPSPLRWRLQLWCAVAPWVVLKPSVSVAQASRSKTND